MKGYVGFEVVNCDVMYSGRSLPTFCKSLLVSLIARLTYSSSMKTPTLRPRYARAHCAGQYTLLFNRNICLTLILTGRLTVPPEMEEEEFG